MKTAWFPAPYRLPQSFARRFGWDVPEPGHVVEIELREPWVQEKLIRMLHEHKQEHSDFMPSAIVIDPKTALQLTWELTGKCSRPLTEFAGFPIHLALGADRVELVFSDDAFRWLLWTQKFD